MKRLLRSLFQKPELKKLNLCPNHIKMDDKGNEIIPINESVPYSTDQCITCQKHLCIVCSQEHVNNRCEVRVEINSQLGEGVLKNFNLGQVIKVDLQNLKCICGKPLNRTSAICAACGLASCSQQCHKQWEKLGNCSYHDYFYNIPEGFTMRSIIFDNIHRIQKSNIKQWIIANKSGTNMVSCYASSRHPYVYLQRGYRNYGIPNQQLLSRMQAVPRALDYYIHFERRCDCNCVICTKHRPHSSTNCQTSCTNFNFAVMNKANMDSKNHKQCNCTCKFCRSGVIFSTHRFIDCMPFCQRSDLVRKVNIY